MAPASAILLNLCTYVGVIQSWFFVTGLFSEKWQLSIPSSDYQDQVSFALCKISGPGESNRDRHHRHRMTLVRIDFADHHPTIVEKMRQVD